MKAVMITIKLWYFYLTYKGIKTVEVRKTYPKNFKGDVYECVSKTNWKKDLMKIPENEREFFKKFVGKVGLKFTLNKVNKYEIQMPLYDQHSIYKNGEYNGELETSKNDLVDIACLTPKEVGDYIDENFDIPLYGWYIENLVIFEEAMWLHDFKTRYYPQYVGMVKNKTHYELKPITKAPQSFMYVEIELHYTPEIPGDDLEAFVGKYDPEQMIKRATERRKNEKNNC